MVPDSSVNRLKHPSGSEGNVCKIRKVSSANRTLKCFTTPKCLGGSTDQVEEAPQRALQ